MINMIRADLYRLVRSKALYIAILFMLLMIGLSVYFVGPGSIGLRDSVIMSEETSEQLHAVIVGLPEDEQYSISAVKYREIMLGIEGYELDRDILGANINLYYVFIFIAVIIITADFSGGSVKNTLSSAISRSKYYLSKLCLISLCCVVILFLNTYIVHFATMFFDGKNLASSLGVVTKITVLQLPPTLALASILTGIGFAAKKTAVFNTIAIPLIMVFQMLLRAAALVFKIKDKYLYYELQSMLGNLADEPTAEFVRSSIAVSVAVIVVFNVIGYISFKKAEIK